MGTLMLSPEAEGKWLASLQSDDRLLFLATLAHQLTVAGRDSYRPGTGDLRKPQLLRKVNEVLHRVTAWLRSELKKPGAPDFHEALGLIVLDRSDLELAELTNWAWSDAKDVVLTSRTVEDL
jgi:hypothetical protein